MRSYAGIKRIAGMLAVLLLITGLLLPESGVAASQRTVSAGSPRIFLPILMYHEVKPYKTGKDVITPYEMESDLEFFRENHYTTITMTDLIDYVYSGKPLPEKPVILSFDDGYLNNFIYVFPLLKKYDMKIVLSIIGKNTDDFTRIPDHNLDYSHVTWNQINEMKNSGLVEIQNHTYDMHKITGKRFGCKKGKNESLAQYEQVLTDDIEKLQKEISLHTGFIPNTFAYPYGQISRESVPVLKKLGFKASLSCKYGINIITRDPETLYGLMRICRSHGVPAQKTIRKAWKTLKYRNIK